MQKHPAGFYSTGCFIYLQYQIYFNFARAALILS